MKLGLSEQEAATVAAKWLDENHEKIANRIKQDMALAMAQSGGDQLIFTGKAIDTNFTITLDTISQCIGYVIAANNKAILAVLKEQGILK